VHLVGDSITRIAELIGQIRADVQEGAQRAAAMANVAGSLDRSIAEFRTQ
jgi:hypothetical protein